MKIAMTMPRWRVLLAGTAYALVLALTGAAPPPAELHVGMVPDAGATRVSIEQKAPLQQYLAAHLHRPVSLMIPTNYNATVEALGNGSLDIAYLGGLTYVKAHARYGAVPLVQRDVDRQFHALFITRTDSGIVSLGQLRGKSFCFGDINSTSGHLMPELIFRKAGIHPKTDLAATRYTGSHLATAQAVATGACDAGAIDQTVFEQLIRTGKLAPGQLRLFYTSQPFADYVWVARRDLDPGAAAAFSQALIALKPGRDQPVLDVLRGTTYVPAQDNIYDGIRATAKALGLL